MLNQEIVRTSVFVGVGALLIALGQPLAMRKVGPNGVYGFRTAITLGSEEIWYAVNERAGKQFRILGASTVAVALIFHVTGVASGLPLTVLTVVGAIAIALSSLNFASRLHVAELKAASDESDQDEDSDDDEDS